MSATGVTREAVATALLAKLANVATLVTIGRKHVLPAQDQQPALFAVATRNTVKIKSRGFPGMLMITFHLFIYACDSSGDEPLGQETALVETAINGILEGIDTALQPDPGQDTQTLGGLVSHCWIEGETEIDPGVFGKQGFAIVPVQVLIP